VKILSEVTCNISNPNTATTAVTVSTFNFQSQLKHKLHLFDLLYTIQLPICFAFLVDLLWISCTTNQWIKPKWRFSFRVSVVNIFQLWLKLTIFQLISISSWHPTCQHVAVRFLVPAAVVSSAEMLVKLCMKCSKSRRIRVCRRLPISLGKDEKFQCFSRTWTS